MDKLFAAIVAFLVMFFLKQAMAMLPIVFLDTLAFIMVGLVALVIFALTFAGVQSLYNEMGFVGASKAILVFFGYGVIVFLIVGWFVWE